MCDCVVKLVHGSGKQFPVFEMQSLLAHTGTTQMEPLLSRERWASVQKLFNGSLKWPPTVIHNFAVFSFFFFPIKFASIIFQ